MELDKKAVVLSLPDSSDMVELQAGIIRTRVKVDGLRLSKPTAPTLPKAAMSSGISRFDRAAATELDLRGLTVDEALDRTDKFLDDARLSGLDQLTIIHGKGTGALRAAIHSHLKACRDVKSFRLGVYGEGETGVTIVEMK